MIYQVDNLREILILSYTPLVICQVEMEMISLRDLHWEIISHLVHNVELR